VMAGYSASILEVPLSPSRQGVHQRAGYKPVPRSVVRVLKVVRRCAHVVCAEPMLKCLCRDQLPIYAWPAVPLGNKLSARLARAIRPRATIISLTAWAAGALEQPMQHQPDRPTAGQFQCGSAAVSSPSSRSASSWPACRAVDSGRS
jgi:hypothetical protein